MDHRPRASVQADGRPVHDSRLAANNLFDVYPTNTPRGHAVDPVSGATVNLPATRYVTPFSNFSPFGFNGRFLYGRVDVNF